MHDWKVTGNLNNSQIKLLWKITPPQEAIRIAGHC